MKKKTDNANVNNSHNSNSCDNYNIINHDNNKYCSNPQGTRAH